MAVGRIIFGIFKTDYIEGEAQQGRTIEEDQDWNNIHQQIIKDQGCESYVEMKRKAENREEWQMAANQSTDNKQREM